MLLQYHALNYKENIVVRTWFLKTLIGTVPGVTVTSKKYGDCFDDIFFSTQYLYYTRIFVVLNIWETENKYLMPKNFTIFSTTNGF